MIYISDIIKVQFRDWTKREILGKPTRGALALSTHTNLKDVTITLFNREDHRKNVILFMSDCLFEDFGLFVNGSSERLFKGTKHSHWYTQVDMPKSLIKGKVKISPKSDGEVTMSLLDDCKRGKGLMIEFSPESWDLFKCEVNKFVGLRKGIT